MYDRFRSCVPLDSSLSKRTVGQNKETKMGRQIQLHLLQDDFIELWQWMQQREITIVEHFSTSSVVEPYSPWEQSGQQLCLWNHALLSELSRTFIPDAKYEKYRVDEFNQPVLELTLPHLTVWNEKPALLQGRIYGIFESKDAGFEKWYNSIVRWIQKNFVRNPAKLGGYVGKQAFEWFSNGGILLPFFRPPLSPEWIRFSEQQHRLTL
jgi:hypothetical protein